MKLNNMDIWCGVVLLSLFCGLAYSRLDFEGIIQARQGDTAFLPCNIHVDSKQQLTPHVIQWIQMKNGLPIVMKIWNRPLQIIDSKLKGRVFMSNELFSASLTIRNVSGTDAGDYQCNISVLRGTTAKEEDFAKVVRLYVTVSPTFQETPPRQIQAQQGRSLLLRCLATGEPKPVITWMKDGYDVTDGQNGVAIGNSELRITSLQRHHAGRYVCRAHSAAGTTQHSTMVNVLAPPQFRQKPQDGRTREGQTIIFSCRAQGYPTDIQYSWLHNGMRVGRQNVRYTAQEDGTLIIRNVRIEDRGHVTCESSNGYGSPSRTTATLTVEYEAWCSLNAPPRNLSQAGEPGREKQPFPRPSKSQHPTITRQTTAETYSLVASYDESGGRLHSATSNEVREVFVLGNEVTMSLDAARVIGMPKVVYAGLTRSVKLPCPTSAEPPVNGVSWIKDGKKIYPAQSERYSTDEKLNLIIHSVKHEDAGSYTCTPRNVIGSRGSGNTRLEIRKLPEFETRPSPVYHVEVGTKFTAPCSGKGDLIWTISWRKIQRNVNDMVYCVDQGNLSIAAVRKEHHGVWQCMLSSQVGDVTANTKIFVKNTTPHQVENLTAVNISENFISIRWDSGFDGGFPQNFVIWYKRKEAGNHSWKKRYFRGREFATIENLNPNTSYQLSVVAQNRLGTGGFSEVLTVKTYAISTPPTPFPPAKIASPSNLTHSISSSGLVVLSWSPQCCDSDLFGYVIEFQRLGRVSEADNGLVMVANSNTASHKTITKRSLFSNSFKRTLRDVNVKRWDTLSTTPPNETSYEIASNLLHRNQLYHVRILAVSAKQYSEPSETSTISTKGLFAYPVLIDPFPPSSGVSNRLLIGILFGLLFVVFMSVSVVTLICRRRAMTRQLRKASFEGCNGEIGELGLAETDNQINVKPAADSLDGRNQDVTSEASLNRLYFNAKDDSSPRESDCDSDEEEKQRLLGESSCYAVKFHHSPPFRERRHSTSEESVRRRREIAARVLAAQKMHRYNPGIKNSGIDVLPRRSASTTPYQQSYYGHIQSQTTCWEREHQPSATSRLVALDDRSHFGAVNDCLSDPVYAVVKEKQQQQFSTSATLYTEHFDPAINESFSCRPSGHPGGPSGKTYTTASNPTGVAQPSWEAENDPHTFWPQRNVNDQTHNTSNLPRTIQLSENHLWRPERPRSQPNRSKLSDKPSSCVSSRLPSADEASLEIDCSNSEIEVRFVNKHRRFYRKSNSAHSLRETCKVGPDQVEEMPIPKKVRLFSNPPRVKFRLPEDANITHTDKNHHQSISVSGLPDSVTADFTSRKRFSMTTVSQSHFFEKHQGTPISPKSHFSSYIKKELLEWKRNKESLNFFSDDDALVKDVNSISSRQFYWFHKANSHHFHSEEDLVQRIAKPKVVSLSEISRDIPREFLDSISQSSSTQFSPCRKDFSRMHSIWGSLDRPLKLCQFPLPSSEKDSTLNSQCIKYSSKSLPNSPSKYLRKRQEKSKLLNYRSLSLSPVMTTTRLEHNRSTANYPSSINQDKNELFPSVMTSSPLPEMTAPESPSHHHHRESRSSGYASQTPIQSSSYSGNVERFRKDNSSVEDNYEWDSEFAAESEILEALQRFENLKTSTPISETLQNQLKKFARSTCARATTETGSNSTPQNNEVASPFSPFDSDNSCTRDDLEKRFALLREEFNNFRKQRNK